MIMEAAERYFLPASLWAVMFTMGLGLVPADFRAIVANRRAFVVGAGSMLFLVPTAGIVLAGLLAPTPVLLMGLILLATTPSGILSNLLTDIAAGDVALSVSISLFLSVVYVFTLPFIAYFAFKFVFGHGEMLEIPLTDSISHILTITLIPVALGMTSRAYLPRVALRAGPVIKRCATTLLVFIFAMIVVQQFDTLRASFGRLMAIVVGMNLASLTLALTASTLARLNRRERIAVSMEHLIRQEATAIYVAVSLLHRNDMSLPMIINTFIGMAFSVMFVAIIRRRSSIPIPAGAVSKT
jgi:BASS family bile acid:Na+ symporter